MASPGPGGVAPEDQVQASQPPGSPPDGSAAAPRDSAAEHRPSTSEARRSVLNSMRRSLLQVQEDPKERKRRKHGSMQAASEEGGDIEKLSQDEANRRSSVPAGAEAADGGLGSENVAAVRDAEAVAAEAHTPMPASMPLEAEVSQAVAIGSTAQERETAPAAIASPSNAARGEVESIASANAITVTSPPVARSGGDNNFKKDHERSEAAGRDDVRTALQVSADMDTMSPVPTSHFPRVHQARCICGSRYLADSSYCGKCGRPRDDGKLVGEKDALNDRSMSIRSGRSSICRRYVLGVCSKGSACSLAHKTNSECSRRSSEMSQTRRTEHREVVTETRRHERYEVRNEYSSEVTPPTPPRSRSRRRSQELQEVQEDITDLFVNSRFVGDTEENAKDLAGVIADDAVGVVSGRIYGDLPPPDGYEVAPGSIAEWIHGTRRHRSRRPGDKAGDTTVSVVYTVGQVVEVWSRTHMSWLKGSVIKVIDERERVVVRLEIDGKVVGTKELKMSHHHLRPVVARGDRWKGRVRRSLDPTFGPCFPVSENVRATPLGASDATNCERFAHLGEATAERWDRYGVKVTQSEATRDKAFDEAFAKKVRQSNDFRWETRYRSTTTKRLKHDELRKTEEELWEQLRLECELTKRQQTKVEVRQETHKEVVLTPSPASKQFNDLSAREMLLMAKADEEWDEWMVQVRQDWQNHERSRMESEDLWSQFYEIETRIKLEREQQREKFRQQWREKKPRIIESLRVWAKSCKVMTVNGGEVRTLSHKVRAKFREEQQERDTVAMVAADHESLSWELHEKANREAIEAQADVAARNRLEVEAQMRNAWALADFEAKQRRDEEERRWREAQEQAALLYDRAGMEAEDRRAKLMEAAAAAEAEAREREEAQRRELRERRAMARNDLPTSKWPKSVKVILAAAADDGFTDFVDVAAEAEAAVRARQERERLMREEEMAERDRLRLEVEKLKELAARHAEERATQKVIATEKREETGFKWPAQTEEACPCGNVYLEDSNFCRRCGRPRRECCEHCGNVFLEDSNFCRRCGSAKDRQKSPVKGNRYGKEVAFENEDSQAMPHSDETSGDEEPVAKEARRREQSRRDFAPVKSNRVKDKSIPRVPANLPEEVEEDQAFSKPESSVHVHVTEKKVEEYAAARPRYDEQKAMSQNDIESMDREAFDRIAEENRLMREREAAERKRMRQLDAESQWKRAEERREKLERECMAKADAYSRAREEQEAREEAERGRMAKDDELSRLKREEERREQAEREAMAKAERERRKHDEEMRELAERESMAKADEESREREERDRMVDEDKRSREYAKELTREKAECESMVKSDEESREREERDKMAEEDKRSRAYLNELARERVEQECMAKADEESREREERDKMMHEDKLSREHEMFLARQKAERESMAKADEESREREEREKMAKEDESSHANREIERARMEEAERAAMAKADQESREREERDMMTEEDKRSREYARWKADELASEKSARESMSKADEESREREERDRMALEDDLARKYQQWLADQCAREKAEGESMAKSDQESKEREERDKMEKEDERSHAIRQIEREAQEKAEREAAEEAARQKAEQEAREKAEREAAEEAARLKAEQEAAEEAARQKAEQEAAEQAAREKAEQESMEKSVRCHRYPLMRPRSVSQEKLLTTA
eukprot:TRINITY_DN2160_c0_g1_i1.p1 TRINITY_DN2160_c0_g1~~TRINITY_DN2160_c0_g1_i1.p1  ORF type:complete len:1673 (-),score=345.56 TRINITY_DN2160_c0_g1_i1:237-5255(-)